MHKNTTHRFPLRRCSECKIESRLGDWNPIPPDLHETCYNCAHRFCKHCSDFWATPDDNIRAAKRFERNRFRKKKLERERKEIAPWVTDIIERHRVLGEGREGIDAEEERGGHGNGM